IFRRVQKGALTLPVGRTKIVAQILNAKGEEQETIDLATNDFGSVAGTWSVPENASTGRYTIALRFGDEKKASTIGRVLVAEFRKPAFEVTLAPTGATVRGKHLRTRVKGRYFFGAPTRGVKVSYSIHKRPARFVPQGKGLRPYHFALEWRSRGRDEFVTSGKGRLDAKGELRIDSKLGVGNSTGPFSYSVEAEVQDIDRQTVTARRNFLVHPGEVYVGVRVVQAMPLVGKTVDVEAITVTPQGKLEKNRPVELAIYRRVYYWFWEWDADDDYRHSSEPTDKLVHKCKARPRGVTTRCSAKILSPGLYVVKAKHKDKLGNTIWASREFSVAGRGDFALAKHPYVRMELMADKNSAKPGEKVKVLVKNPFKKATLLLTVERHGVLFRRVVPMKMGMRWFELPIEASYAPNVFISAYLVSGRSTTKHDGAGRDVGAPQYRIGYTKVSVDNQANHLGVRISAERHEYHPGDALRVKLRVTDPFGRGVKSEVALAIVDESVLSLTNYKTPQPQNAMYPPAILKLFTDDSRWGRVQKLLSFVNKGYQGGGGDNDDDFEAPAPIKVRRNFVNTLLWKPQLVTDSNGELTASVKLPDNLTTYRIFAVVMDRTTRFGASEHKVVVNKPFMLRTALPRFFKQGDHVTAGVVAHNGTGTPLRVAIELRAPGIVVEGARRRTLVVPPKSSKEVAFRFQTPYLGDIPLTFIATATGGDRTYKDAVERKLPVQPTLLFQTAQNQGQFLGSTAIELRYPPGSLPEQGRLELEVSPSILSGLRDSLDYLVKYPYGCVEQTTSSTYPLLSLIELFPALGVERHARQKLAAMAKKGIDRLVSMQTSTGGLAYWPGGKHPHLYGTAYAMLALTQAKRLKIPMPKGFLPKVAHYLEKSLAKGVDQSDVRAHILYVLAMAGLPKAAYATRLFEERKLLSLFGKSLLLLALKTIGNQPLLVDRLIAEVEGEINRDGTLKHPETSRYYSYWSSNLRNQAIALTALVATKPSSAVIVPLAQAILDSRHNGYWYTTQKTTYALMSITAFSRTMESSMDAARFVAQLGERTIERSSFTKVGSSYRLSLDLKEVLARPGVSLKLRQLGDKKRLFYTLRTRFTRKPGPDRESTVLAKGGLLLYKRIEDIDGKDLTGKPVPSGALVRVRLFVYAPTTMRYLAVNDPLPAGLEALNTALSTTTRGKVGDMLQVGRYHPRRYYLERT
ncbi:MAG: hypothetical protein KC609_02030, partial [Myxococcales bacterium]|nr:hypothetical protein [Myxococcales bacterium]